jgi:protein involved in polysaccharide export with SLBB domain
MGNGERRKARQARQGHVCARPLLLWPFLVSLVFLAGCAHGRHCLERALLADCGWEDRCREAADAYQIGCPDVLVVAVAGSPGLSGRYTVGPDGRIDLGPGFQVRVEGFTVAAAARCLASALGVRPDTVAVCVQEYRSQEIYLVGEVTGQQRAVPYQGPETVLDLLQRVGGVTPGAAPGDVYVVRSHIAEGRPPQVFHIDLCAILLHNDPRTNLRLQPFDQVHVGETRKACYEKCVPPCLRPLYEKLCGLDHP